MEEGGGVKLEEKQRVKKLTFEDLRREWIAQRAPAVENGDTPYGAKWHEERKNTFQNEPER